ncbi:hypothetical protein CEQ90_11990 [Lewinellaceae bacterium SD302]|nr:hypothetical protein CEQ90_11990 [Lewinellaceae bacterium SD302]
MANANRHIPQDELLRRYLSGEIDARGEAELFRAAGEDDALAEALAGYQLAPEADHQASLSKLRSKLPGAKRKSLIPVRVISIAASLLLLLFVGYYGYQSSNDYATAAEAAPMADSKAPAGEKALKPANDLEAEPSVLASPSTNMPSKDEVSSRAPTTKERVEYRVEDEATPPSQRIPENVDQDLTNTTAAVPPPPPSAPVLAEPEPEIADDEAMTFEEVAPAASVLADSPHRRADAKMAPDAKKRPAGVRVISGFVTDENDRPIASASITLPGQPIGESTDSSGYFEFVADQTVSQLQVGHPEFEDGEILLPRNENELIINLSKPADLADDEDDWLMSGARTTVYPNAEKTSATIKGGMRQLRRDIQAAKPDDLPAGLVKVSFSVQADGSLTDFSFGRKSEEQLIDFVRNYLQQQSQWKLRGGSTPTRMAITFRFR